MAVTQPRWLQALEQKPRAPQKAPPPQGALRVKPHAIPQELRLHDAWAVWHWEREHDRWSKPPYNPTTGQRAEPGDPSTWSSFEDALRAYRDGLTPADGGRPYDGISFALNYRFGLVGVDLDHVSEHQADAARIVRALDSYSELSPSGDGIRIFCKGTLPEGRRRRDWVEMTTRRFLSVTGHHLDATPETITAHPTALYGVWARSVQHG